MLTGRFRISYSAKRKLFFSLHLIYLPGVYLLFPKVNFHGFPTRVAKKERETNSRFHGVNLYHFCTSTIFFTNISANSQIRLFIFCLVTRSQSSNSDSLSLESGNQVVKIIGLLDKKRREFESPTAG